MNRLMRCLLFIAAIASVERAFADTPVQQSRDLQTQAMAAYKAGDFAACAKDFAAALALRPHNQRILYNIAACSAKAGHLDDAIAALNAYADMSLVADVEHDADFEALKGQQAFTALLARFKGNLAPVGSSSALATLAGPPFLAEGIAFDPAAKRFFVGSVDQRRIVSIGADGTQKEFAATDAGGLLGAFGMAVDGKHNRLWVASSGVAHAKSLSDKDRGANAVLSFALADGHPLSQALLAKSNDLRIIGDVATAADGGIFATDSVAPVIYAVDGDTISEWLRKDDFVSLQGVTTTPDGSHVIVADYVMGLHFIDRKTKAVQTQSYAGGTTLLGIDGLYRRNNTLLAVQNGINPQRIIAMSLASSGLSVTGVTVLSANDPNIPEPSLGTIAGNKFCVVANAQWSKFKDDGSLKEATALDPVHVACVALH